MTLRDDIRESLRDVVDLLGETWQYRRLTSGPATETRTYGAWADVTAHPTSLTWDQTWNEDRQAWERTETQRLRIKDDLAQLNPGDQVRDTAQVVWAVGAQQAAGVGTKAYTVMRTIPLQADAGRGGGV